MGVPLDSIISKKDTRLLRGNNVLFKRITPFCDKKDSTWRNCLAFAHLVASFSNNLSSS